MNQKKNRAILFTENETDVDHFNDLLIKFGRLDFSVITCNSFEECLKFVKEFKEDGNQTIVLCQNAYIDKFLMELNEKDMGALTLIFEQAVKLQMDGNMVVFIPTELDCYKFLKEVIQKKEINAISVFGKTKSFVEKRFKEFKTNEGFNYKIITKCQFLHIIYYSQYLDHDMLKNVFGDSLFSYSGRNLADACFQVLNDNSFNVSIFEQISAGFVTGKLICAGLENDSHEWYEGKLPTRKDLIKKSIFLPDVKGFDIENSLIEEYGENSKEVVYEITRKLLKNEETDLALCVIGDDAGKIIVAVGNSAEIHLFSTTFQGEKKEIMVNASNFALFRLYMFVLAHEREEMNN